MLLQILGIMPWCQKQPESRPAHDHIFLEKETMSAFYYDRYSLPVTNVGDGGDTLQRVGFKRTFIEMWLRTQKTPIYDTSIEHPDFYFKQLETLTDPMTKVLVRHPLGGGVTPPWNDPSDTSRDQLTPNICALALLQERGVGNFKIKDFQNEFTAPNGDYMGPNMKSIIYRGVYGDSYWLGDMQLIGDVIVRNWHARKMDDTGDDLNLQCMLLVANTIAPTWATRTAMDIYRHRSYSFGSYLDFIRANPRARMFMTNHDWNNLQKLIRAIKPDIECSPWSGAIRWYFREEAGGNEGFYDLCGPVLDQIFGDKRK